MTPSARIHTGRMQIFVGGSAAFGTRVNTLWIFQKVVTFNDIFLPEKEEQLMKLIQERILSEPSLPEELTQENWKPVISQFDLVKEDSVWCWQIDCLTEPDLELPRAYYPLRATIAEKSLAEYLSYPVPQE